MHSTESLEILVRGNRVCNYSGFVAITFTLYDWASSVEEEVAQILTRPWSNLKSLYTFIRLVSIVGQMVPIIISLQPSSVDASFMVSRRYCQWLNGFQGVASQLLMMAVQIILILRVEALYQKEKRLKYLLRALYIGEFFAMSAMLATQLPQIQFGPHCVITHFPTNFATPYLLLPVAVEFVFFILTMVKFCRAVRDGWSRQSIIFRFLRDGIWAFALPFVILTINTLCIALLPGPFSSIAYSWIIAIPGFAGCRLILNMSHLLRRSSEGPCTYPPQDFQLDTEFMSQQHTMTFDY